MKLFLKVAIVACLVMLCLPSAQAIEERATKAAEAYNRGLKALEAGDIDTAVQETVMASTLDPKAVYFLCAARAYILKKDTSSSFLYANKGISLADFGEQGAMGERNILAKLYFSIARQLLAANNIKDLIQYVVVADKLAPSSQEALSERALIVADFKQRASVFIANIRKECPATGEASFFELFRPIDEDSTKQILAAFKSQQSCFLGTFPELPTPVKVSQNGLESPMKETAFILLPGKVEIRSASNPPFMFEVTANPQETKAFFPRKEPWMLGKFVLKGLPPDPTVKVDGNPAKVEKSLLEVTPYDEHRVEVSAPGRKDFSLEGLKVPLAASTTVEVRARKKSSWIPWVLMGSGVAIAGAGGYFVYAANAAEPTFEMDANGVVTNMGREQAVSKQNDANNNYTIGWTGIGLGGALLAGGLIWMLIEDTTPPEWR